MASLLSFADYRMANKKSCSNERLFLLRDGSSFLTIAKLTRIINTTIKYLDQVSYDLIEKPEKPARSRHCDSEQTCRLPLEMEKHLWEGADER